MHILDHPGRANQYFGVCLQSQCTWFILKQLLMPFNIVMFCLRSKFLSSENSLHSEDSDVFFGKFLGIELSTHMIYRLGIQGL